MCDQNWNRWEQVGNDGRWIFRSELAPAGADREVKDPVLAVMQGDVIKAGSLAKPFPTVVTSEK